MSGAVQRKGWDVLEPLRQALGDNAPYRPSKALAYVITTGPELFTGRRAAGALAGVVWRGLDQAGWELGAGELEAGRKNLHIQAGHSDIVVSRCIRTLLADLLRRMKHPNHRNPGAALGLSPCLGDDKQLDYLRHRTEACDDDQSSFVGILAHAGCPTG
uniref:Uncharacterized protein n=1 Tax=Coccidioides posadasii RMSCC 3488 TaxID=454284 RepID=A0A0J6F438_COCPO|nr:hypothetical protein CPAG_01276 [Coccidioides posadasii RMSCC 3488]